VRLLLDQNLSPRLCQLLADLDATVAHVRDAGLQAADDAAIWDYALGHGFMIVTKDSDFNSRALLFGTPPKVVSIRLGNCSTRDIELLLRSSFAVLTHFAADTTAALLVLE
jgi:predicted nuclease of predicted toxin-antitoxin system